VGLDGADKAISSRSLMPILSGADLSDWGDDVVCSEQEETRVIRTPKWAYFKRFEGAGTRFENELFDVENDRDETVNLAADPQYRDVVAELDAKLIAFFKTYADPKADLWHGGAPIQHSERTKLWQEAWGDDWQPVYTYR
jgi:arylsulfatase A-like enzyme